MPGSDPRPASTVILVRDALSGGLEVLMVERSERSSFMGGAYVFPGGGVDEADSDPRLGARCTGLSDEEASRRLSLAEGGLAYWVSAVRELFEESGILLATDAGGSPIALTGETTERFAAHRDALNARRWSFAEMVAAEGLVLDLSEIFYVAHWVTPVVSPTRFDTRFFVAVAPDDQEAIHDAGETVAVEWVTPPDALRRHRDGEIDMVMPTIRTLRFVQGFATAEVLLAHVASMAEVPRIEPRMARTAEGPRLLVPGDEGYDTALDEAVDGSAFTGAARRRALEENWPSG